MFRDVGHCPFCASRLRWEPAGVGYWRLMHGDTRLGATIDDAVFADAIRQQIEGRWPREWHERVTREDGA